MPTLLPRRYWIALAALGAGGVAAALLGAPATALLVALAAGAAAGALVMREEDALTPPPPPPQEESADWYAVLDAIDDPLLLLVERRVAVANRAARALLGQHFAGQDVRLAIRHPAAQRLLAGEAEGSVELVGLGAQDRRWRLEVHALSDGASLVRLSDRTDQYGTERMRVDFVANASHELRTPLATILGFVETLEEANDPRDADTRLRFLKIMGGEARRMQRLVDDLISLSRIEAEKYRLPQVAVPLGRLAHETVDAIRTAARAPVEIETSVADGLGTVIGDRAQLSQLLHNLVDNAVKYGRAGAPVKVALAQAGTMVRLTVADQGDGIPAQHIPRLTERFYRVDPGRSRSAGGTGLGLAIVKHIVERHRGRLEIASEIGHGTTVTVLLPAAPAGTVIKP